MNPRHRSLLTLVLAALIVSSIQAAAVAGDDHDLSRDRVLYMVGYAHLDTQWRWDYQRTIRDFIPKTMHRNFALFEKYPDYVFNFTGSFRYMLMKEYYPEDFQRVKEYIKKGRWYVCGSSVDECDANVPSPESIIRHILYGNTYFRKEFGKASIDFMLPDCFGFPASLPSSLAHCGLRGFSTQKLRWGSAVGIPFPIGVWEGPDGRSVVAALDPGSYVSRVKKDLSRDRERLLRIETLGKKTGVHADYRYYGVGDTGGAPDGKSVEWIQKSIAGKGPITVVSATSDRLYRDLRPPQIRKLDRYAGDLLLTEHSAGSLTSQGYMKRWNRKNELLADAAERAAVTAHWLGGARYPRDKITDAWVRVLASQMHDILPGTSIPKAYNFSWNDEVVALNRFAAVLEDAVGAVAAALDTRVEGVPLVVVNPLSFDREDVVEARVRFPEGSLPEAVRVFGPDGREAASQVTGKLGDTLDLVFLAKVPSVGLSVFDVRPSTQPCALKTGLAVTPSGLENEHYSVRIDKNGDVESIRDRTAGRELLAAPAGLVLLHDAPARWPAWNMDWKDRQRPLMGRAGGPAKVRVVENGPARVTLEVDRETLGSRFVQRIQLGAGSRRVEFNTAIDWMTRGACLKAAFPLAVSADLATYNLGLGTIQRGTNTPKKYEVPSRQWFDLTGEKGDYGVAVLEDCKYASDKPDDHTLRLTLVRTPVCRSYQDQATQDLGRHSVLYGLAGHTGTWQEGGVCREAASLNQPMIAFQTSPHPGMLGNEFSLLRVTSNRVSVRAVKMAEAGGDVIVRLQECHGKAAKGVRLAMATPILSAHRVDGQERPLGKMEVKDGKLSFDIAPYGLRTFALRLAPPPARRSPPVCTPLEIPFNTDVAGLDSIEGDGDIDGKGNAIPAEMLPATITAEGILFNIGPTARGKKNAVACRGQKIALPENGANRLYLLAAASGGDTRATFRVDGRAVALTIQEWTGFVGQWDNRIWEDQREITCLENAYIKRDPIAWYCSHHHDSHGKNVPYMFSYLFKYRIDLPAGAGILTLPDCDRIRILAATAARNRNDDIRPARFLYDAFTHEASPPRITPDSGAFSDSVLVRISPPFYCAAGTIHYTTDGTDPTAASPLYEKPFLLSESALIKARAFRGDTGTGPRAEANITVNDTTPPALKAISAVCLERGGIIIAAFSEPLDIRTATSPEGYRLDPDAGIKAVSLDRSGTRIQLTTAGPLRPGTRYTLRARGLRDRSPGQNEINGKTVYPFTASGPALHLDFEKRQGKTLLGSSPRDRAAISGDPAWTEGMHGKALDFDGQDDHVIVKNRAGLNPTSGITVCAWIKARDWKGNSRILQKGNDDTQYRLLKEAGRFKFSLAGRGEVRTRIPPAGTWCHVAGTYDGRTMRLFLNGVQVAANPTTGPVAVTGDDVHIATKKKRATAGDHFNGLIDEVRIYGLALPPDAIRNLAKKGSGVTQK